MRRNTKYVKLALLIIVVMLSSSCNKFLDEMPSKNANLPITKIEQLDAIFSNYSAFWQERNKAALVGHDNDGLAVKQLYDAIPRLYSGNTMPLVSAAVWDYESLAKAGDGFWTDEYSKIFKANMVLEALPKVNGTGADKARLEAEAHFIRAYSYWNLANTYCLPYTESNKQEPGLPIKNTTGYEESAARASLEATYTMISSDLAEALKINTSLTEKGTARPWRASKAGVNAFAARFFLNQNNYSKALEHANIALQEYNTLVDYNTEMKEEDVYGVGIFFPSSYSSDFTDYTKRIGWKEHLYTRLNSGVTMYMPSQSLLDLYDRAHDLRFKYHMVENLTQLFAGSYPVPGYVFFTTDLVPSGPTTAEMYLIKAECEARTGNFNTGMQTLNQFRAKRISPGSWLNLVASNKEEALKFIAEERRREMPFSQRWFDLRRYNNNEDPNDDVVVTKTFYKVSSSAIFNTESPVTYTLEKNSRKYALPIANSEIDVSKGQMKQNTY